MSRGIDTRNACGVSRITYAGEQCIALQRLPPSVLTRDEALVLAAWLVLMADDGEDFPIIQARVATS